MHQPVSQVTEAHVVSLPPNGRHKLEDFSQGLSRFSINKSLYHRRNMNDNIIRGFKLTGLRTNQQTDQFLIFF